LAPGRRDWARREGLPETRELHETETTNQNCNREDYR
jgi:hypothetical protein